MGDCFISRRDALLANWKEAFPQASVSSTAVFKTAPKQLNNSIFWIHAEIDRSDWVANVIKKLFELHPQPKIIVLANSPQLADTLSLFNMGVLGYCHAYTSAEMLLEVKTVVSHGGIWLGRDLLQHLIVKTSALVINNQPESSRALKLLTQREREVALQAARGLSNKEIARVLHITDRTIKAHLSHAYEKLGVKDRLQLALALARSGRNNR